MTTKNKVNGLVLWFKVRVRINGGDQTEKLFCCRTTQPVLNLTKWFWQLAISP